MFLLRSLVVGVLLLCAMCAVGLGATNALAAAAPSPAPTATPQALNPTQVGQSIIAAYAQKEKQVALMQQQFQEFVTELAAPACKGQGVKSVTFPKWHGVDPHPYPASVKCKDGRSYTVTGVIAH